MFEVDPPEHFCGMNDFSQSVECNFYIPSPSTVVQNAPPTTAAPVGCRAPRNGILGCSWSRARQGSCTVHRSLSVSGSAVVVSNQPVKLLLSLMGGGTYSEFFSAQLFLSLPFVINSLV